MGTRNLIVVVLEGNYHIAQYGQWDGYPTGEGQEIVDFILNKMEKEKFKKALLNCKFLSEKEIEQKIASVGVGVAFHRDTGSKILFLVQEGVCELEDSYSFSSDSLYCEFAYVIDMDTEILEVYTGFIKSPLKEEERFYTPEANEEGYYPVKLYAKYPFSELTKATMETLQTKLEGEEC